MTTFHSRCLLSYGSCIKVHYLCMTSFFQRYFWLVQSAQLVPSSNHLEALTSIQNQDTRRNLEIHRRLQHRIYDIQDIENAKINQNNRNEQKKKISTKRKIYMDLSGHFKKDIRTKKMRMSYQRLSENIRDHRKNSLASKKMALLSNHTIGSLNCWTAKRRQYDATFRGPQ